jgi:hypothetical protein
MVSLWLTREPGTGVADGEMMRPARNSKISFQPARPGAPGAGRYPGSFPVQAVSRCVSRSRRACHGFTRREPPQRRHGSMMRIPASAAKLDTHLFIRGS